MDDLDWLERGIKRLPKDIRECSDGMRKIYESGKEISLPDKLEGVDLDFLFDLSTVEHMFFLWRNKYNEGIVRDIANQTVTDAYNVLIGGITNNYDLGHIGHAELNIFSAMVGKHKFEEFVYDHIKDGRDDRSIEIDTEKMFFMFDVLQSNFLDEFYFKHDPYGMFALLAQVEPKNEDIDNIQDLISWCEEVLTIHGKNVEDLKQMIDKERENKS